MDNTIGSFDQFVLDFLSIFVSDAYAVVKREKQEMQAALRGPFRISCFRYRLIRIES